jgi:hypothetical protein
MMIDFGAPVWRLEKDSKLILSQKLRIMDCAVMHSFGFITFEFAVSGGEGGFGQYRGTFLLRHWRITPGRI